MGRIAPLGRLLLVGALAAAIAPACSLGQGTGCFGSESSLDVPDCWSGAFDLHPDFFAAVPTNGAALEIRIQNGTDYETFSDGLMILVDDLGQIRGDPLLGSARPSLLGQALPVSLPPSVTPAGVPVKAVANPALVHATLYLGRTCRTQNVALYAMDAVSLEPDGTCNHPDGGEPPLPCGAQAATADGGASDAAADGATDGGASAAADGGMADAGNANAVEGGAGVSNVDQAPDKCTDFRATSSSAGVATSMIRFNYLFDGQVSESNAKERLTDADFDLYLADPRETCPGGIGPPPRCRGHLQGHVHFYFQRGRPAQPFP
jgi:hypothetical protein